MSPLVDAVRHLIVRSLRLPRNPETIDPDADLFGGEFGLDSVDAVQLVTSIEKHFDIRLSDTELARHPLSSVRAIARLLEARGVSLEQAGKQS
jgi:acyl carrier protein